MLAYFIIMHVFLSLNAITVNITEKVSLHDRCPFITGTLHGEDRPPLWEKSPDHRVSSHRSALEDRFYCTFKSELTLNLYSFHIGQQDWASQFSSNMHYPHIIWSVKHYPQKLHPQASKLVMWMWLSWPLNFSCERDFRGLLTSHVNVTFMISELLMWTWLSWSMNFSCERDFCGLWTSHVNVTFMVNELLMWTWLW